jgi:hypothetical protein
MSKFLLCVGLCLAVLAAGSAQTIDDQKAKRSDEVIVKVRQLDLLNHILPVIMTKEQLRTILPAIEKARGNVRTIQRMEADDLIKFEAKVDAALGKAYETGQVPTRDLLGELQKLMHALGVRRSIAVGENMEAVMKVVEQTLDPGQKKAAANSMDPGEIEPGRKVEEMTEEQKLRFWVQYVLLDPIAYEVLVKLSR